MNEERTNDAPRPALDENTLYMSDEGRLFCGRLPCAGMTAHFTGRGLHGEAIAPVTADEVHAWIADLGHGPRCETCRREATAVLTAGGRPAMKGGAR